jgi:hypothetical protein
MSILVSQLPALLSASEQVVSDALANEVSSSGSTRDIVISQSGLIASSKSNASYKPFCSASLVNNSLVTEITGVNAPVDVSNTNLTLGSNVLDFALENNKTLKYIGTQTNKVFQVTVFFDVKSGTENQVTTLYIVKNGNVESLPRIKQLVGTNAIQNGGVSCIVPLTTNDTVGLRIENNSGANNLTIGNLSVVIVCIN